jgi:EAL domain-containing protein (putative c-di-GMP-specific phosphodiesterase class I)
MEKDTLIKHKNDLIDIYTANLQKLEKRQAEQALEFDDLIIANQIENIQGIINQTRRDLLELQSDNDGGTSIRLVPYPLQKYEDFITKFSEEILTWNQDINRYEKLILTSLKRASDAKCVFIARYNNGNWNISGDDNLDEKEMRNKYFQSGILNHVLNKQQDRQNGDAQLGLYTGRISSSGQRCLIYPFTTKKLDMLVFHDINENFRYDRAFELILQTIFEKTQLLRKPQVASILELHIYNSLRKNYGFVSDAMYDRQYYLFNQSLNEKTVEFEPIIFLSPDAPSIYGWEALARENDTKKAPVELFETAELWGIRFQLQLDMFFLQKAVELYVADPKDKSKFRRKNEIQPLSVNVHPASLLRTRYKETVRNISAQGRMPLNKLYLEISEKAPIPAPDDWDRKENVIDAFRYSLDYFRDYDIHFSVDDFGIGYSSSSRVSRLGPAIVKIDRDALMDNFGGFTLEFIIRLAKRLPGETKVVLEGFDDDSVYSLRKLYNFGIRYVQGHEFGVSRPEIDDRLQQKMIDLIKAELSD